MYKIKLSPYHKIFYEDWKLNPQSCKYNIVFDQTISNNLDLQRLDASLTKFVSDYVLMNSHIIEKNDEYYWVANDGIRCLEQFSAHNLQTNIYDYVCKPFDLNHEPLYRFAIFQQNNGNYRFVVVFHHLIMDGSSIDITIYELSRCYNNNSIPMLGINAQLKAISQTAKVLENKIKQNAPNSQNFWHNQLKNIEEINLKFLKANQNVDQNSNIRDTQELRFSFGKEYTKNIKQICRKYAITPYFYSKCIFAVLLYKYTGQQQFVISYPVAITSGKVFICGVQVNTSLIPFRISLDTTIMELFHNAKQFIHLLKQDGFNYRDYPINKTLSKANKNLLNVMFAKTNFKDTEFNFVNAGTLAINHELNIDYGKGLLFEYESKDDIINYRIRYNAKDIDAVILNNFLRHYIKLFFDILFDLEHNTNNSLSNYNTLHEYEYQQIVYDWNNTKTKYSNEKTIHQIFEEQALKIPNNIAIVCEQTKLTYKTLNQKTNQLANYLGNKYQIQANDLIAVCIDRSEYMIIAPLAILKLGGAYIPVDPVYPDQRISHILKDTHPKLLLTNQKYQYKLEKMLINSFTKASDKTALELIDYQKTNNLIKQQSLANPDIHIKSNDLAYVIYTSGTTGKPKGIMIEHRSVVNFVQGQPFDNSKYLNASFTAPWMFDASIFDIWSNLLYGHCIFIVSDLMLIKDAQQFEKFILKNNINRLYLPSLLLRLYVDFLSTCRCVTQIFTGVEPSYFKELLTLLNKNRMVINGYGPSETTVYCTNYILTPDCVYLKTPIGRPLQNTLCYVLDTNLNPMPIGAIGELYVGGTGLARGYLNSPELTQNKFIFNPFQTQEEKQNNLNNRLYKTGDLVRYLADGNLEYIGRNDSQIKVRGYRVELSEIEEAIIKYPGIQHCLVTAIKQHNNKNDNILYIIAYYVANQPLDNIKINNYLLTKLPEYMIPNGFMHVKSIPTTLNGKLDKILLPQLSLFNNEYVQPSNFAESLICKIYSEILQLDGVQIGSTNDFFRSGGNSILAIHLLSKLQAYFKINMNDIYLLRTPAKIAQVLPIIKGNIENKLQQINLLYRQSKDYVKKYKNLCHKKQLQYYAEIKQLNVKNKLKGINNVLLTGSTGYLGCNLLYQLLLTTKYKIYLLIRAVNVRDAYNRINDKFKYYFNTELDKYRKRIEIDVSDLSLPLLGLNSRIYYKLTKNIDSIIHCAALTKHYGSYEEFYQINVVATINLLDLSKLTNLKDFHYISTYSILNYGNDICYTEHDFPAKQPSCNNIYIQTKFESEQQVVKYRGYGVNSNIYRVGNLAFMLKDSKVQQNAKDNAFFNLIRCIYKMRNITRSIDQIEISPADLTAKAIICLFDQSQLINDTYHIFNPYKLSICTAFINNNLAVKKVRISKFLDYIKEHLDSKSHNTIVMEFLLYQGWLDTHDKIILPNILQNKTEYILNKLNFRWDTIKISYAFEQYINYIMGTL